MPVVHDVVRHPKTGDYATCTVEFKAVTLRDDGGETVGNSTSRAKAYPTPPVDSGLDPGEFSINLAEGLYETRLRILGATATEWVRFVNPPGGGRYLTLIQAFTGVPEDPSALEALVDMLQADAAATYVRSVNGTPVDPETGNVVVPTGEVPDEVITEAVNTNLAGRDLVEGNDPRLPITTTNDELIIEGDDATGRVSRFVDTQGHTWIKLHEDVELPGAQLDAGSVSADKLDSTVGTLDTVPGEQDTVIEDEAGRYSFWARRDGRVEIPKLIADTSERARDYVEVLGTTPNRKLAFVDGETGRRRVLTDGTTDSFNPRTTPDRRHVVFDTPAGQRWVSVTGAANGPMRPTTTVAAFGDSLTESIGADWPGTTLATALGISVTNMGKAGWASADIAIRQGALSPLLTLSGNQIPAATTAVTVTALDPATGYRAGASGAIAFTGTLAGIPGTLTHTTSDTWNFVRTTAGSVVSVPAGTPFIGDTGAAHRAKMQILWPGRNNVGTGLDVVKRDLLAMVANLTPWSKTFLVPSILNSQGEGVGTANYTAIAQYNAWLASTFGDRFYDIRHDFIHNGLAMAGIAPTSDDNTAMANDRPPPSLMQDTLHPNTTDGYEVVGLLMAAAITDRGWIAA